MVNNNFAEKQSKEIHYAVPQYFHHQHYHYYGYLELLIIKPKVINIYLCR